MRRFTDCPGNAGSCRRSSRRSVRSDRPSGGGCTGGDPHTCILPRRRCGGLRAGPAVDTGSLPFVEAERVEAPCVGEVEVVVVEAELEPFDGLSNYL